MHVFEAVSQAARDHALRPAIVARHRVCTYSDLARLIASVVLGLGPREREQRVALLVEKDETYVAVLLGSFLSGAIAVPLCTTHPLPELLYSITDSQSCVLIYSKQFQAMAATLKSSLPSMVFLSVEELMQQPAVALDALPQMQSLDLSQGCLIMYTSGSTGQPKGVVHTLASLHAQMASLTAAWGICSEDRILHVLPVHHIHGIVNALLTVVHAGGTVELMERFDAAAVWTRLLSPTDRISLFMAVPTIYTKLLAQRPAAAELGHVRLCISGSAALPTSVREAWRAATGHVLLERYGMTEIGMALSCGLALEQRIDSSVGLPLPLVELKLVRADDRTEILGTDEPGEIWVSGPLLFREYFNRPEQTAAEFHDGWFRTGDIALRSSQHGAAYFIQGRNSVDIIKSGGYKISALEVEREILSSMPSVLECACVGVSDEEWGQRVAVLVVTSRALSLAELRDTLKARLAPYKVPSVLKVLQAGLPRNAMGKVNKKELQQFFS
ncbi:Acyl-CoA synthetase member 3, mitochondrial [Kappamyces sp. JEL0680]|nr:Acyl-CoA synthetase member 3, mitochondrial [Kappamyces sp. JEL0680]